MFITESCRFRFIAAIQQNIGGRYMLSLQCCIFLLLCGGSLVLRSAGGCSVTFFLPLSLHAAVCSLVLGIDALITVKAVLYVVHFLFPLTSPTASGDPEYVTASHRLIGR